MSKFSIGITLLILAVLGCIVYLAQGDAIHKALTAQNTAVPTFPPDADTFKMMPQQELNGQGNLAQTAPRGQGQVQGAQAQQQQAQQAQQQQVAPTYGVEAGVKASYSATIRTTAGNIKITLDGKDAPNTVKNFIKKAQADYYKGLIFHRVEDWVVQGGDPLGNGTGGGQMLTEPNNVPFTTGSLGVARGGDPRISNDSQFFFTKTDASWLNGQYTNFGQVTEGMDVVNKIKIGDKILGITVDNANF